MQRPIVPIFVLLATACGPFDPGDWITTTGDEHGSSSDNGVTTDASATGPQIGTTGEVSSTGPEGSSGSTDGMVSSSGAMGSDSTPPGESSSTGPVLDDSTTHVLVCEVNLDTGRCECDGTVDNPALCGCFLDIKGTCSCDDGTVWPQVNCGWTCEDVGTGAGCICGNFPAPPEWCKPS